jgi:hypothetical protein
MEDVEVVLVVAGTILTVGSTSPSTVSTLQSSVPPEANPVALKSKLFVAPEVTTPAIGPVIAGGAASARGAMAKASPTTAIRHAARRIIPFPSPHGARETVCR